MRDSGQRACREYCCSGSIESNVTDRCSVVEESNVAGGRGGAAIADGSRDCDWLSVLRWIGVGRQHRSGTVLEINLEHRMQFNAIRSNACLSVLEVEEPDTLYLDGNIGRLEEGGCGQTRVELSPGARDSRP